LPETVIKFAGKRQRGTIVFNAAQSKKARVEDWLKSERGWLTLARSYKTIERIENSQRR
jgi:hypothetical protein